MIQDRAPAKLLLALLLLGASYSLQASILNPNSCVGAGTAACPGTLDIFNGDSVVLLASTSQAVNPLSGTYTGTLLSAVYMNVNRNNQLDFYYQFTNGTTCSNPVNGVCDAVVRETDFNFNGFTTDVGYRTDFVVNGFVAGNKPPLSGDKDAGSTVGFRFDDVNNPDPSTRILPGNSSRVLIIRTNATNFAQGFASTIDGGATTVFSFQPASGVPEPGSWVLLGSGGLLVGLAASIRRRRERKS